MLRVIKLVAFSGVFLFTTGSLMAQGFRDANAKANGNFGTGFSAGSRSIRYMQGPTNYYSAPQLARTVTPAGVMSCPPQIAQSPIEVRRFSGEPTQSMARNSVPALQERRSFSIEPSTPINRAPVR
jgi:hypothetical protein